MLAAAGWFRRAKLNGGDLFVCMLAIVPSRKIPKMNGMVPITHTGSTAGSMPYVGIPNTSS